MRGLFLCYNRGTRFGEVNLPFFHGFVAAGRFSQAVTLLGLLMIVALSGCGGGGGSTASASNPAQSLASSISSSSTSDSTPAPKTGLFLHLQYAQATKAAAAAAGLPATTQFTIVHVTDPVTGLDLIPATRVDRVDGALSQDVHLSLDGGVSYAIILTAFDDLGVQVGFFTQAGATSTAAEVSVTVSYATSATSLSVQPGSSVLGVGHTQQFIAVARFADGLTANVTSSTSWTSSSPLIAAVSDDLSSKGRVAALAPGTSTITAVFDTQHASASVTVGGLPAAPTGVSATAAGVRSATVSWSSSVADAGNSVTSYTLFAIDKTDGSGGVGGPIVGPDTSTYTYTELTPGHTYVFTVQADNAVGTGPVATSNEVVVTGASGTVPGASLNVVATVAGLGPRSASVSWSAPADDGGSSIRGYLVYALDQAPGGAGSATANPAGDARSFTFNQLMAGHTYVFTVIASNGVGNGPAATSNPVVVTAAAGTVPTAPATVAASVSGLGPRQAMVTWSAPASDGGSAILSYTLFGIDQTDGTGGVGGPMTGSDARTYTYSGLVSGHTYIFTVQADNGVGTSPVVTSNAVVIP